MKYWLLLLAAFSAAECLAQKQKSTYYRKEFSVLTENDAYMLKLRDGYYSAGLFLQLSIAKEKDSKKIINRYELGQTMFTTGNRRAVLRGEETIDRPYCGFLYAKYSNEKVVNKNVLFAWNATLGVTGRWSLAQQLQESYHKLINLYFYPYWEVQIPNAVGANAGINYRNTVFEKQHFKVVPTVDANAGMFYTNAKLGSYFCFGRFESNGNSALFNTKVNHKELATKGKHELFLYFYPQLIVQGYNATLQGTLFYKEGKDVITSSPSTLMYQQTFGVCYARPRWTARIEINWQTKETPLQNRQQRYGGVQFAYRFN